MSDLTKCTRCGHALIGHNFREATRLVVPCEDCPSGLCDEREHR